MLPISCDNGCPEWSMIEMQGELERKGVESPDEEFPVGQLRLSSKVLNIRQTLAGHWPGCTAAASMVS